MSARQTTVTPWLDMEVRVECRDCDAHDMRRLHRRGADALRYARQHVLTTGHVVEIKRSQRCLVGLSKVTPVEGPNQHVQKTWAPEGVA